MDAPMCQFELKMFSEDISQMKPIINLLLQSGCCIRCVLRYIGEKDSGVYRKSHEDLKGILLNVLKSSNENSAMNIDTNDVSDGNPEQTKGETTPDEAKEQTDTLGSGGLNGDPPSVDDCKSKTDLDLSQQVNVDKLLTGKPCVACLGILQEFSSESFIQKIDNTVLKGDFEFSDFICSLTIPVCVLIRERALLTHLQEKFKSVYGSLNESDISSIKDVWKWRNGPVLGDALGVPFEQKSKFDIAVIFTYKKSDKECNFLVDFKPDVFKRRKQLKGRDEMFTRANVAKALSEMTDHYLKKTYKVPPKPPDFICKCDEIRCTHEAVYIAGRYNKYSRTLSQTPWFVDGKRKSESSVEEEIYQLIKQKFRFEDHRFSSSGREDVDVKMLGRGRPFVIEMINPHRVNFSSEDLQELQKKINSKSKDVQVRDLQIVTREETDILKEGETDKIKVYTALCFCDKPMNQKDLDKLAGVKDLVLKQKTPIRVLHRRPLATRERMVYTLSADYIDDFHFKLHLSTQAGTYVKEFVHGDFGRTKPNMSSLTGVDCDILELDVESVELDWPKQLETN